MTVTPKPRRSAIAGVTLAAATLPLAACGGGGGGVVSTPVPPQVAPVPTPPPPSPPPAPPPAPAPAAFNQTEYDRSNGPSSINAAVAYRAGFNGAGQLIGIVDSGIDQNQVEFAGRISPLSRDFAGNSSIQDEGSHGTLVAGVLAAAANERNTLGVAWGSTILALRTDRPGSCAEEGEDKGCKHPDPAIASAIDFATNSGAKVINISLGGAGTGSAVRQAIARATSAGVIIVISAGNDGTTDGGNPDPFAQVAADPSANGLVIIAGALAEDNTTLAPFSNKAGAFGNVYLSALGTRVRTVNNKDQAVLASGTSFAAPIISGAIALLRQAFPNLTARQVVDLVYRTARDLGQTGTDDVFGRGGLDLTRAFQPQGQLSLPGSTVVLGMLSGTQLGTPMGDGGEMGRVAAVALDELGRAYQTQLAGAPQVGVVPSTFAAVLREGERTAGLRTSGGLVAVSVSGAGTQPLSLRAGDALAARATALTLVQRLDARTSLRIGLARGSDGLAERLDGAAEGAFLVAGRADRSAGLLRDPTAAVAVSRQLGPVRLSVAAESGDGLAQRARAVPTARGGWDRSAYSSVSLSADGRVGPLTLSLGGSRLDEAGGVLGARLGPALGGGRGAASWFLDAGGSGQLGGGVSLGVGWRQGWTVARSGGALTGGTLRSTAWSLDAGKQGLFGDDLLSLRLSQPLRISGGGLTLSVPVAYDYDTLSANFANQRLSLTPLGAERTAELAYARSLWGGALSLNGWWRTQAGNNVALGDEGGALLRWSAGF